MGVMPTNVTPEFRKAQARYRKARDPAERLEILREMLRLVPKHKGTEHLRAEMRTKVKELTARLSTSSRGGARTGPPVTFRREGAAQVALVGPPNTGKSALHARLTGSHADPEPYPYATQHPVPGMLRCNDVAFQLIDVPSLGAEHSFPFVGDTLQHADACLFVVDLAEPGCVVRAQTALDLLTGFGVDLIADWQFSEEPDDIDELFRVRLPTLLLANKADLLDDPDGEAAILEELLGVSFPHLAVSAASGAGLEQLGPWLFEHLGIIRVYTKVPGSPPDMEHPFALRAGETVHDLARRIHKDVAAAFSHARVWGPATYDGQQVGRDHRLVDGDVVEIHT